MKDYSKVKETVSGNEVINIYFNETLKKWLGEIRTSDTETTKIRWNQKGRCENHDRPDYDIL